MSGALWFVLTLQKLLVKKKAVLLSYNKKYASKEISNSGNFINNEKHEYSQNERVRCFIKKIWKNELLERNTKKKIEQVYYTTAFTLEIWYKCCRNNRPVIKEITDLKKKKKTFSHLSHGITVIETKCTNNICTRAVCNCLYETSLHF